VLATRGGEGEGSVKLVLRGSLSLPVLSSLGKERWFSSTVEAGEVERGESITDMDMVRLLDGRKMGQLSRDVVAC
jgi:hypothetical protein